MKFTVALPELQKALQKILPAIPAKSTIPVLEHVHVSLAGSELTFTATDQEITIALTIPVAGEADGDVLIPARQFNDLVKELGNAGTIEVHADEDVQVIIVRTPTGTYEMKGLDAGEFPSIPPFPEAQKALVSGADMARMSNKTVFAVSTEEYRPSMTGVFFRFDENKITAVATDGFRLSRVIVDRSEDESFPNGLECIVPARAVELLRKVDSDVVMEVSRTHARFTIASQTITTRIIDEKYPPYQNVIPSDNDKSLIINQREVLSAIKRVSLFANTNTRHVRFRINERTLAVHSEDEDSGGKGTETIPCEFSAETFEVGFNYRFLEEAIKNISVDDDPDLNVRMTFSTPIRAVLITPGAGNDSLLMLVMPVKI
ncbi:MAG: DNA polymerase III subunit beta ['Candidatus Kapabacteria' thiocyanatum]|uniref:Beta sliding clamp n=1 Tax=Candidatus Kapaibacterium thiocyanatum TaxID=1895771 RepID=A0A1M3KV47_9BACT|nr:DNA polymerase III subunit beta ['Candidatus Kapabacteria' thiocyanatum]OJX56295.1 MAG: DNA polymerase III subunit beta ['Candidatus Kapabacteria' thiocyanatum]